MFSVHSLLLLFLCFHLNSTINRSVQYLPECFQIILEDIYFFSMVGTLLYVRICDDQIEELLSIMERSFSRAVPKVFRKCEIVSKLLIILFGIQFTLVILDVVGEALLPLSARDLEIQRLVYKTKHSERRLPFHVLIPFIDETESWTYGILFVLQVYISLLIIIVSIITFTAVPIMVFNLYGQYKILSKYVEKIGKEHRDALGNCIIYSNIETNTFFYIKKERETLRNGKKLKEVYERNYIKQIVRFHQKLLLFQKKVSIDFYFLYIPTHNFLVDIFGGFSCYITEGCFWGISRILFSKQHSSIKV
ncbi:hypothetical protein WDU94_007992 [Cyamophila willieti]